MPSLRLPSPLPFRLPSRARRLLVAVAAVVALAALWHSALPGVAYYWFVTRSNAPVWKERSLWLPDYRADIDGRPIAGLKDNVSGLTYSPETGTLFAVVNRRPEVAEITTDGELLRRIPIAGGRDTEGIAHVEGDLFVVSDEGDQSLHWVRIGPETERIAFGADRRLRLDFGAYENMGFEGVSWDARRKELFVVQEMLPPRVLVVGGLASLSGEGPTNLDIREWQSRDFSGFFSLDLSSMSLHEPTGNLLLLSHMSSMLVEYAPGGEAVSMMPLRGGRHGLSKTVAQAEGVAVGPNGDLYIVSEPNLFYRFKR